jgi:ABC-type sugar transport system ATPase subunit
MLLRNENLSSAAIFQTKDLAKSYGGVNALRGVTLDIRPGEILGLCGENGSGKSTFLKIISGQIQPTSGTLFLDGKEVDFRNPNDALKKGISAVTQERTLASDLTVAENIYLSHLKPKSLMGINWKKTHSQSKEILNIIGCDLDTNVVVRDILPGQAQMVEIARAIIGKTRILILDEPTSSLTSYEVEKLFSALSSAWNCCDTVFLNISISLSSEGYTISKSSSNASSLNSLTSFNSFVLLKLSLLIVLLSVKFSRISLSVQIT